MCMRGYSAFPIYNPGFRETLEGMSWLLDDIPVHVSYPP
jgi:hypothetical protein